MTCSMMHGQNSPARSGEISKQTFPNVQAAPSPPSARLMGGAALQGSGWEEVHAAQETVPFQPASLCLFLLWSWLPAASVGFSNHKSDHALLHLKALQQLPTTHRRKHLLLATQPYTVRAFSLQAHLLSATPTHSRCSRRNDTLFPTTERLHLHCPQSTGTPPTFSLHVWASRSFRSWFTCHFLKWTIPESPRSQPFPIRTFPTSSPCVFFFL